MKQFQIKTKRNATNVNPSPLINVHNNSGSIDGPGSNLMNNKKKSIVMNASVKFGGKSARIGGSGAI